MMSAKRIIFLAAILIACLVAVLVHPFKTTVVPEWRVLVCDESGRPIAGITIEESWSDPIGPSGFEELQTDSSGHVVFPQRTVRAIRLRRIVKAVFLSLFPHQQSGPSAFLLVVGD